uniref:uncharacterized protein LOC122604094 n=1 Tax=Erigeron canadensis TaxID=72917 RepID=UPI001CB97524|nr:uncharacterized protein LOC122604094 [Erigeron canadensis]
MKNVVDDLALAQRPVDDEDLIVHIINQLGGEYGSIVAAIKARENPISYPELFDKLVDYERTLKETSTEPLITTVNHTQHQPARTYPKQQSKFRYQKTNQSRTSWNIHDKTNTQYQNRPNKNTAYCYFYNIPSHETKDCRKLGRFLRDHCHPIQGTKRAATIVNYTSAYPTPGSAPTWMWDTGANGHTTPTPTPNSLPVLSEYGGPDEIELGDGQSPPITHIGHTNIQTNS